MSFMIDVPMDSGDLFSGVDGDATAVEPSLFGKCILDVVESRFFTFDAILNDFSVRSRDSNTFHQLTINFHQTLIHFVMEILSHLA